LIVTGTLVAQPSETVKSMFTTPVSGATALASLT
jgi:hypothetical protein